MRTNMVAALALVLLTAGAARAEAPAMRIAIDLSSFKFTPATTVMTHGQPYLLHLANSAHGGHDFVAKGFFAAATVAPASRTAVRDGEVELDGGEQADITLIAPPPGRYEVHCSHFMHTTFGMKGVIVVN